MTYMCICAFKHSLSHELVINSNSIILSEIHIQIGREEEGRVLSSCGGTLLSLG